MDWPQIEVEFDKAGRIFDPRQLESALEHVRTCTDAIVISHGWNNDRADATDLYDRFFEKVADLIAEGHVPELSQRRFAVIRILWPSKRFTDSELIPGGGAASVAAGPTLDAALIAALERLGMDAERLGHEAPSDLRGRIVSDAQALVPRLGTPAARREFVLHLRSLVNPAAADAEDGSLEFFARDPEDLFAELNEPVAAPIAPGVGGAAGVGGPSGGAAGLRDVFRGVSAAAYRLVNFTTYYEMKERAGLVGRTGVRQMLGEIRGVNASVRLHLVGHSFGGRLVTAAARELAPHTPAVTLALIQAAFSHNGLGAKYDGERDGHFRPILSDSRVSGPILITHTKNDLAVGIAYPLASRFAFQKAAALGDENDPYGGMGRNGAQHTPEAQKGLLLGVTKQYSFVPGRVYNLKADEFIRDHSDVARHEVAYAVLKAGAALP
jgi:hypothetical protein